MVVADTATAVVEVAAQAVEAAVEVNPEAPALPRAAYLCVLITSALTSVKPSVCISMLSLSYPMRCLMRL